MTGHSPLRLGLIGIGIGQSAAPRLHRLAGGHYRIDIDYPLFDLADGGDFDDCLGACADRRGVNVTHPFKTRAIELVETVAPEIARLGAINTVLFDDGRPVRGANTDHSGFIAAYRAAFAERSPGRVALFGAGGVGRPLAAALIALGAEAIQVYDPDRARAETLAAALGHTSCPIVVAKTPAAAATDAAGLVNATPLGMHNHPGSPLPAGAFGAPRWAFDAVYTPVDTVFLGHAATAGAVVMSGYRLFLWQGIHAFELFIGQRIALATLTRLLAPTAAAVRA